jgi:hypothetical protein
MYLAASWFLLEESAETFYGSHNAQRNEHQDRTDHRASEGAQQTKHIVGGNGRLKQVTRALLEMAMRRSVKFWRASHRYGGGGAVMQVC